MKKVNTDTGEIVEPEQIKPFAAWLTEQSQGKTHTELSEGLHDLIDKVRETGKKGSMILTVTVSPLKEDVNVLVVSDEIRLKLPEHARKPSVFFADEQGNLSRTDPRQLTFEGLKVIEHPEADAADLKEVEK